MEKVLEYALYFFIYAILGWCVEVIHAALKRGKFENRGFLNGCWCPIYGAGVVLVLLSLTPININVFVLFISSSSRSEKHGFSLPIFVPSQIRTLTDLGSADSSFSLAFLP